MTSTIRSLAIRLAEVWATWPLHFCYAISKHNHNWNRLQSVDMTAVAVQTNVSRSVWLDVSGELMLHWATVEMMSAVPSASWAVTLANDSCCCGRLFCSFRDLLSSSCSHLLSTLNSHRCRTRGFHASSGWRSTRELKYWQLKYYLQSIIVYSAYFKDGFYLFVLKQTSQICSCVWLENPGVSH